MFWIILSFQRLHNVFIKGLHIFFLFQIYLRNLNQGKYGLTHFVLFQKKWSITIKITHGATWVVFSKILNKFWWKGNLLWVILYFQGFYISFHQKLIFFSYLKYFLQNSNFRIIRFDPSCPFKKILIILLQKAHWMWPDSTRISVKIQSGSTHIAFLDYSDRDNMVKLVLFFQVILSKRQYSSNHIVF